MKYVRHEKLGIFIFPDTGGSGISHRDMVNLFAEYKGKFISAGFINFRDNSCICHGYSQSTGLGSLDEDSKILNEQLNIK